MSILARITTLPRAHRIVSVRVRPSVRADRDRIAAHLAASLDALLGVDVLVFRKSCWRRAMVLQRFLALNGIDSRINFGVQKHADGTLHGHAWLERDGHPILEHASSGVYVVTFTLPQLAGGAPVPRL